MIWAKKAIAGTTSKYRRRQSILIERQFLGKIRTTFSVQFSRSFLDTFCSSENNNSPVADTAHARAGRSLFVFKYASNPPAFSSGKHGTIDVGKQYRWHKIS